MPYDIEAELGKIDFNKLARQSGEATLEMMDKYRKALMNANEAEAVFNKTLDESGDKTKAKAEEVKVLDKSLQKFKGSIDRLNKSTEDFEGEMDEAAKSMGLFASIAKDADEQVTRFADGMGESATGATAMGVALVFAATKIKELGDSVGDALVKFAKFNQQAQISARTTLIAPGGAKDILEVADALNLTTEEADKFFKVLADGSRSGVASTDRLVEAASRLEEVFGDDPTERLESYVDLLKEIPTLETDLKITASLDDQAAAWFALAQKGKVSQVIEMQMAGLLGGEVDEVFNKVTDGDREIIKATREGAKWSEDIYKWALDFSPDAIGKYSQIIGGVAAIVTSAIGIGTTLWAQYKMLTNVFKANESIEKNTAEIARKAGGTGTTSRPGKPGLIEKATKIGTDSFARGRKGFDIAREKGGGLLHSTRVGISGGATQLVKSGVATGGVAGKSAQVLGGVLKAFTSNVGAASAQLGGLGSATATAAAGVATVGGVLFAAVAPIVLIGKYGDVAGQALKDFSKDTEKTGGWLKKSVKGFGDLVVGSSVLRLVTLGQVKDLESLGDALQTSSTMISSWASNIWESAWGVSEETKERRRNENAMLDRRKQEMAMAAQLQATQRSALSMEKAFGAIEAASSDSVTALARMNAELAGAKLEELGKFGGSAVDFSLAVEQGIQSSQEAYRRQSKALKQARDMILKDANMNAQHRAMSLAKLHKAEMEAAKALLEGVLSMVGEFDSIPSVAAAEIQRGISSALRDISADVGSELLGNTFDDILKDVEAGYVALQDVNSNAVDQMIMVQQSLKKVNEEAADAKASLGAELGGLVDTLNENEKKLASVSPTVNIDAELRAELGRVNLEEITGDEVSNLEAKINDNIKRLEGSLSGVQASELVDAFDGTRKAAEQAASSMSIADKEMKAAGENVVSAVRAWEDSGGTTEFKKVYENIEADAAKQKGAASDAARAVKSAQLEQEKVTLARKNAEEEKEEADKEAARARENVIKAAEGLGGTYLERIKNLREQKASEEVIAKEAADILRKEAIIQNAAREQVDTLSGIRDNLKKQAAEDEKSLSIQQGTRKTIEGQVKEIKNFVTSITAVVNSIDNNPVVVGLKREEEKMKQKAELARLQGKATEAGAAEFEATNERLQEQLSIANKGLVFLKRMKQASEQQGGELAVVVKGFDDVGKLLKEELGGDEIEKALKDAGLGDMLSQIKKQAEDVKVATEKLRKARTEGASEEELKILGDDVKKGVDAFRKSVDEARGKAVDVKDEKAKAALGSTLDTIEGLASAASLAPAGLAAMTKGIDELETKAVAVRAEMIKNAEAFDANIDAIDSSLLQKAAQQQQQAASSLFDLAERYGDASKAGEAYGAQLAAVNKIERDRIANLDAEKKQLKSTYAAAIEQFATIEDAVKGLESEDTNIVLLAEQRLQYERLQAKVSEKRNTAEKEADQSRIDASAKVRDIERSRTDLIQEGIDDEIQHLEAIGGSYEEIFQLQQQSISLQAQRVEQDRAHLKRLEDEHASEFELAKARLDLQKSENKLRQDAMGAQRNAYEQLVGLAFGAIRGARGARRQLDEQARFVGRGAVTNQAGIAVSGSAGRGQTIAERAGAFGAAANRAKEEEQLKRAESGGLTVGDVKEGTAQAYESVAAKYNADKQLQDKTNEMATSAGSIYTHDEHVEAKLVELIGVVRDAFGVVPATAVVGGGAATRVAEAATAATEAAATAEVSGQRFEVVVGGQVDVKFNSAMFRSEVVDIVAREVNVPGGALQRAMDTRYPAKGAL